ncbi:MAG: A/G-specific adenine glycosylase [Nitrososphaerota archaeon]
MPAGMEKAEVFRKKITEWYLSHGDSNLPWRRTRDSWAMLVAAFLLRKTTVKQVAEVYEEFLRRYPSPRAVLHADADEIKTLIKPLGIENQRSQDLIELARRLVEKFEGAVPCSREELEELPGVGDYIASEVLLASCGRPEPLLDRNIIRVLERFFGLKSAKKRPHTDPALWSFARTLTPQDAERARSFSYGVLDFARKVCTARKPYCDVCPLSDHCTYYLRGMHTERFLGCHTCRHAKSKYNS